MYGIRSGKQKKTPHNLHASFYFENRNENAYNFTIFSASIVHYYSLLNHIQSDSNVTNRCRKKLSIFCHYGAGIAITTS